MYCFFYVSQTQESAPKDTDKEGGVKTQHAAYKGSGKTVAVERNEQVSKQLSSSLQFDAVYPLNDFFTG